MAYSSSCTFTAALRPGIWIPPPEPAVPQPPAVSHLFFGSSPQATKVAAAPQSTTSRKRLTRSLRVSMAADSSTLPPPLCSRRDDAPGGPAGTVHDLHPA